MIPCVLYILIFQSISFIKNERMRKRFQLKNSKTNEKCRRLSRKFSDTNDNTSMLYDFIWKI